MLTYYGLGTLHQMQESLQEQKCQDVPSAIKSNSIGNKRVSDPHLRPVVAGSGAFCNHPLQVKNA